MTRDDPPARSSDEIRADIDHDHPGLHELAETQSHAGLEQASENVVRHETPLLGRNADDEAVHFGGDDVMTNRHGRTSSANGGHRANRGGTQTSAVGIATCGPEAAPDGSANAIEGRRRRQRLPAQRVGHAKRGRLL